MYEICKEKFLQHDELQKALLSTGNEILINGNNAGDHFWGTVQGKGENHLGEILMQIRDSLRKPLRINN